MIRWVNVADEGDLIAVPKGLSQYFDGVDSDAEVTIGSIAFHDVEAYLRCSEVANILAAYDEGTLEPESIGGRDTNAGR
ncbi:conserved hypothetical protein (plasmid) [Arthrobacter sp. Hiyo8]|nr:conserved hypothetical protein [Arthrobacter sp. Hiyo8]